jgi:hypothetical protein
MGHIAGLDRYRLAFMRREARTRERTLRSRWLNARLAYLLRHEELKSLRDWRAAVAS